MRLALLLKTDNKDEDDDDKAVDEGAEEVGTAGGESKKVDVLMEKEGLRAETGSLETAGTTSDTLARRGDAVKDGADDKEGVPEGCCTDCLLCCCYCCCCCCCCCFGWRCCDSSDRRDCD